jgi:hypothetical protein
LGECDSRLLAGTKTLGLYKRIVICGTTVGNCDGDVSSLQIGGRGVSDTALKTRKDAEPEQWERALKKAIERAGAEERPKILDLDF